VETRQVTAAYIPCGAYWSTPFARWQGSLAHLHALTFAAWVAKRELASRRLAPEAFDYGVLGLSIPQKSCFYGLPWMMGLLGADHVGGPTISQACATSARCIAAARDEIAAGAATATLVLTADRTSNGPHLYYPDPSGPGGTGQHEDWVLDNFSRDPYAGVAMVQTAENVARRFGLQTAEQHDVVLRRYEQYAAACADDHAFHRRFMTLPFEVPNGKLAKTMATLDGDEGIHATTREGLAKLKPVLDGGTVTFGGQTHPADGNAAIVVATRAKSRELSQRPEVEIRVAGIGQARTDKAHMPYAPVPASRAALRAAGIEVRDLAAVKSHNPFVVNDLVFARETGFDVMKMNNFGCSLVWGHPQGPTGLRAIIELIEELVLRGGGWGLFNGCAAGDSAMAVVIEVRDARA
jgi:acetyl-CoA acetyltransferase